MRARRWLPAAGFGTVLLLGAVLAAMGVGAAASSERRARYEEHARGEADRIVAALERNVIEMERLAALDPDPASFRRAATPEVEREIIVIALAHRERSSLRVSTVVPSDAAPLRTGADLLGNDELEIVITSALADADSMAGTPFVIRGRQMIAVAAPVIGDVSAPESGRRGSVTGVVIGAVDVTRLLAWPGDLQLTAPDGRSVGGTARGRLFTDAIDITGRAWTIRLDQPATGWPTQAWLTLAGGAVLAVVGASTLHAQIQRRRRAEGQASDRAKQLERIADAGARLQQSLDLSELLPAFAVGLADDFDLRAVSISLLDDEGSLTQAFSTGDVPERGTIELPLRRGWRSVGVLTVQPGRALDEAELTSLQALADLLAVAMSNAQLYEREQASAARLRDLDALKNAFLGTVSHELRTSMTAIMGFGELLSDAWDTLDDDRRREMAARIRRSAGSLRHLVDDLLDFARLEQERLRVSPRMVDLSGIVRQMVDTLSPLLGKHRLELQVAEDVRAWADPIAIERILANLVSNAAKYSPAGSTVTVAVEEHPAAARLAVSDQGPGIPAEERRRIFARFYRLDTPEAVRTRGAGIGLAILRDFADRSAAVVSVDDAPGGGARFTIDFPISAEQVDLDGHERAAG